MFTYIIKRVVYFIPTLFAISLLAFSLSKCTPGDPVETHLSKSSNGTGQRSLANAERQHQEIAELFGLVGPEFYFSLTSQAYPDSLHRILKKAERENWTNLIAQYGNWEKISAYKDAITSVQFQLFKVPDTIARDEVIIIRRAKGQLNINSKHITIINEIQKMETAVNADSALFSILGNSIEDLKNKYTEVVEQPTRSQLYVPAIHWHGLDNQYHRWISKFIIGDFGISYRDLRPVNSVLKEAIFWTLIMNLMSIFIAYIVSIPLGVFSAVNKDTRFDRITSVGLFILYSLPSFWIATILVVFFTTPEYGAWTNIFPSIGLGDLPSDAPFWDRFWETGSHLILPVLCMTYASLAFISRQMRGGMLDVIRQDYIRTARAKGLAEKTVIWKHAFRNSLFPIITLFATVFPAALAGSVVIEVIFNIPGMGKLSLDAIFNRNYPIIFTVLMLAAVMTMIGNLVADILYAVVDPRVSYDEK